MLKTALGVQKSYNAPFFVLYEVLAMLVMFSSFKILYLKNLSYSYICYVASFGMVLYWLSNRTRMFQAKNGLFVSLMWIAICIYYFNFSTVGRIPNFLQLFARCLCGLSILALNDDLKTHLLKSFSAVFGFMLLLSIGGWILYLFHIPMPHYTEFDGVYYTNTYYPTFQICGRPYESSITRFNAVFQEPGHLASTCVLLLFANKFQMGKKYWYNIVFLVSILLSLSLAGYGLLLISYTIFLLLFSKRRTISITLLVLSVGLFSYYQIAKGNEDSAFLVKILSRLEYDETEGDIVGNNRYSLVFKTEYERFIQTDDKWLGLGFYTQDEKWWVNSAGWKRAVVTNGIIGFSLILLFYFYLAKKRKSVVCLLFFLLWCGINAIRDHIMKECWLYVFICALPLLQFYDSERKQLPNS